MIYFKEDLVKIADKLKSTKDHVDELNDLIEINNTISRNDIYYAIDLDQKLRNKYPIINIMLDIANSFPKKFSTNTHVTQQNNAISSLIQDRYGICAHMLLNDKVIPDIKEFIDYVD